MSIVAKIRALLTGKQSFMRDIVTLMTGNVISRVIMVAAIPFLARIYTPAEFGVLALFMLVNAVFATLACGGYESAIVIQEDDRSALHMVIGCMLIVTSVALVEYGIMLLWAPEIAAFLNAEELSPWLLYSPIAVWALGMSFPCQFWLTRRKQFKNLSQSEIVATSTTAASQILLGTTYKSDAPGLVIGQILGRLAFFAMMAGAAFRQYRAIQPLNFSFGKLGRLMGRYKNFPLYNLWANILNVIAREVPVLILGIFFATTVVGLYTLAYRLVILPFTLVVSSIQRVWLPKAKEAFEQNRLNELSVSLLKRLTLLSIGPTLMLIIVAPELITIILGDNWTEAGAYVQYVAIWGILAFCSTPFTEFFYVLERLRHRLIYFVALAGIRFAGLLIGGYLGDPLLAVALASIGGGLVTFLNTTWLLKIAGVPLSTTFGIVLTDTLKSLPFVAVVLAAQLYSDSTPIVLATLVISGGTFVVLNAKRLFKG